MRKIEFSLIGIVAMFTAIVLPTLNKGHSLEFGTTADWVIAFSNVAMACAAVYAALMWFRQKTILNTLDVSHSITFEFEKKLWEINQRLYSDTILRTKFFNDISNKLYSRDEIKKLTLDEIGKYVSTDLDDLAYLYSSLSRLKRHGIIIEQNFNLVIEKIIAGRANYLQSHYKYISLLAKNHSNTSAEEVSEALNEVNNFKRGLAVIFQYELSNIDINTSYIFE